MRRTSTARKDLGLAVDEQGRRRRRSVGAADRDRSGPRRGAVRRRSGSRRIDGRRVVAGRGAQERPRAGRDLPGRAADRAVEDRRRRAAGRRVGREGRDLHQRSGHGAGRLEGDQRAGRSPSKTGRFSRAWPPRSACPTPTRPRSRCAPTSPRILPATCPKYADASPRQVFNRPVSAEHWLKASNPMERWKWDTMFQDLPPVKGHNVQMEQMSQPTVIPLRLVTEEISRASE